MGFLIANFMSFLYYGPVMKYAISTLALAAFLVPSSALAICNGVGNACSYAYDYTASYSQPSNRYYSPQQQYAYHQPQQYSYGYQQPYPYYGGGYGYGGYGYSGYSQPQPIYFPVYNTYIPNLTPNYGGYGYGQQYGGYGYGYGCGTYTCY